MTRHNFVALMGYNVKRFLVDQGSSIEVPMDLLQHYLGVLVGFTGDKLESSMPHPRTMYYLVALPLNEFGVVVSSLHLKVIFPTSGGEVGVLTIDQELVRKCYEGSMKNQRPFRSLGRPSLE
ncbi:hypothetical protein CR513_16439, partial [Mucuna pruriens]